MFVVSATSGPRVPGGDTLNLPLRSTVHLDLVGDWPLPWMSEAACRDVSTDFFFAEDPTNVKRAKEFCLAQCSVVEECRGFALAQHVSLQGVFGGMSWADRKALRNGRRKR